MSEQTPVVLIADDDSTARLLMSAAIEKLGFTPLTAEDGEQALELYLDRKPDLVLLDVEMPHLSGFDVCRAIRATPQGLHVPIIIVTGQNEVDVAYEAGATNFIQKPINWTLLQYQIRYILRANQAFEKLHKSEARVHFLAYHDVLTNLPNLNFFEESLSNLFDLSKRSQQFAALFLIGLDRFQRINETLGRQTGDRVLCEVATRLAKWIADPDFLKNNPQVQNQGAVTLARYVGDEFLILVSGIHNEAGARPLTEQIQNLFQAPFQNNQEDIRVASSVGVAFFPQHGRDLETLLQKADTAMSVVKNNGGNSCAFYDERLSKPQRDLLRMEVELADGIANDQLQVYYQPRVNTATQEIIGAEALVRWIHPTQGMVNPSDFIPLAEEGGLITALGNWVLRNVCRQINLWRKTGIHVKEIGVNVSARQFWQSNFCENVFSILKEANISPKNIELELTESTLIHGLSETVRILRILQNEGFSLAIDDFGTGWSSLSYLTQLPMNTLKIDRSFVIEMGKNASSRAVVDLIIGAGHKLNMKVVAEGVETLEQFQQLKALHCDYIQGYFFGKPMPADEFAACWLRGVQKNLET